MVKSAYFYLTIDDSNHIEGFDHLLWLKAVPLKVNIFVWRLFLNRLATNDNLCKRCVLEPPKILVRHSVVAWRKGIACSLNVITTVIFGS